MCATKLKFLSLALAMLALPAMVLGEGAPVSGDCLIRNFDSRITARNDASLLIREEITADCGNLAGKHGIFRIVPDRVRHQGGAWNTPIKIVGITDKDGNNLQFLEQRDRVNNTVTWKVGDPNVEITGTVDYVITYTVLNAVRNIDEAGDELYWNILGNFWEMSIEHATARIDFPQGFMPESSEIQLYSGDSDKNGNDLAKWEWDGNGILKIDSTKTLAPRQGITVSVTFPKGIIDAYSPTFLEMYGNYFWLLLPLAVFIVSFWLWLRYGRDPVVNKTIIPEFEIPDKLTPISLGLLGTNGVFEDKMIAASIVNLAVKKYIFIEEIKKTWVMGQNDYRLTKNENRGGEPLSGPEKILMDELFKSGPTITMSDLKKSFYLAVPKIRRSAIDQLISEGYLSGTGLSLKKPFLIAGFVIFWSMIFMAPSGAIPMSSFAIAGGIAFIFGLIMPKRTPKGAITNWKTKGFRLYMKTAERYRQQFNEKENIFEKFLPYAIVFGMADIWIKKVKEIYGDTYFANYRPAWYSGIGTPVFDASGFSSRISSLSASIAANTGTASGAHGSGHVGGGGGGGGGGSW